MTFALTRCRLLLGASAATLAGGAVLAGVELEVLPGKASLYHHLGADGPDGVVPDVEPARVHYGAFRSAARGQRVGWALAAPPGANAGLPGLLALHGRGQDHTAAFLRSRLALDRFLTDAVRRGVPPFAIVSVDGGETYWHDRASGDRAETMMVEELLPRLDRQGLDTTRLALTGWSMGGFGALHLAGVLGPDRVRAVAAMPPPCGTRTTTRLPAPTTTPPTSAARPCWAGRRTWRGSRCGLTAARATRSTRPPGTTSRSSGTRRADFERGDHDRGTGGGSRRACCAPWARR